MLLGGWDLRYAATWSIYHCRSVTHTPMSTARLNQRGRPRPTMQRGHPRRTVHARAPDHRPRIVHARASQLLPIALKTRQGIVQLTRHQNAGHETYPSEHAHALACTWRAVCRIQQPSQRKKACNAAFCLSLRRRSSQSCQVGSVSSEREKRYNSPRPVRPWLQSASRTDDGGSCSL